MYKFSLGQVKASQGCELLPAELGLSNLLFLKFQIVNVNINVVAKNKDLGENAALILLYTVVSEN